MKVGTTEAEPYCVTSRREQADPLLAREVFHYRAIFYPLGFAVEVETNSPEVLLAAQESWRGQTDLGLQSQSLEVLKLRIGVGPGTAAECPPATSVRAYGHMLSIIADAENFVTCDLERGFAFGWVNTAASTHRAYLRYHFLEAAAMCLITGSRATPIHAACVGYKGTGFLLCGESGAGKSTLAYACARAGFAFTTDDASYVEWHSKSPCVRGNAHQVRFRPSARELFPELRGLALTPRTEGKPSIEVPTSELPEIVVAPQTSVHAVLLLNRYHGSSVELVRLSPEDVLPHLEASLYPLDGIYERQSNALRRLLDLKMYEFRYRDLDTAVAQLKQLAEKVTKQ